ncbi:MAG: ABC transporter ATP-binding protein [Elusimicrobiota bacterium]
MSSLPLLEITDLGKAYAGPDGRPAVIVQDFNLRVEEGEFVCVIGPSGCGKSTVLSIVMGLNDPSRGGVVLAGREIDGPGTDRGVVFQSPSLFPWLTAGQNVELAVGQAKPRLNSRERRAAARSHLEAVGLPQTADLYPHEISAGMKQRVGIARAYALEPKVLLLDEPFSLLDAVTRIELQDDLVRVWEERRKTVVMVTHDVDEALFLADRIVLMTAGPAATVGEILAPPFPRPRRREDVLGHPDYYRLRDRLIDFLEDEARKAAAPEAPPEVLPTPYEPSLGRVLMEPAIPA